MLYDTHKRYGQVAGLVMMPVALNFGVMEVNGIDSEFIGFDNVIMNTFALIIYMVVALRASMFGAKFPDFDSPGSRAAQEHKVFAKLFRKFGVKHRGKFSHDFLSQAIVWGIVYGFVSLIGMSFVTTEFEAFALSLVKVYVFFGFVGVLSHLVADAMTTDGVWFAWKIKVRFMPVFIRKVNIFGWRPFKTWFTTASAWNDINYKVMTTLLPIAGIISVIKLISFF